VAALIAFQRALSLTSRQGSTLPERSRRSSSTALSLEIEDPDGERFIPCGKKTGMVKSRQHDPRIGWALRSLDTLLMFVNSLPATVCENIDGL
jgi:hypothetical protein